MIGGMAALAVFAVAGWSSPEASSTAAAGSELDRVLARVEAAEGGIRDISLSWKQTTYLKATGEAQTTTGTLSLLRNPERFRVKFTSPTEQLALYDGKYLWLYLPEAGQAFKQKAGSEELARLLGLNHAEPVRSFRHGYRSTLGGCDAAGCTIDFARGGETPMTWHVRVSSSTWQMDEAWFENDEVKVSLACYDYRVNRRLSPESFKIALPRDVEVQEGLPMLFGRQGR